MAYADAATIAGDAAFQSRVRAAMFAGCARVGSGSFIDDNQKASFLAMMHAVIANPDQYTTVFCWVLPAFSGITTASTDADIDTAIDALWPAISGYLAVAA